MYVRQHRANPLRQRCLVAAVEVGEEQADRNRLGAELLDPRDQLGGGGLLELFDHSVRAGPLACLEPQLGRHQGRRLRSAEPVQLRPVLAPDLEQVAEPLGSHQRRPLAIVQGSNVPSAADVSRRRRPELARTLGRVTHHDALREYG